MENKTALKNQEKRSFKEIMEEVSQKSTIQDLVETCLKLIIEFKNITKEHIRVIKNRQHFVSRVEYAKSEDLINYSVRFSEYIHKKLADSLYNSSTKNKKLSDVIEKWAKIHHEIWTLAWDNNILY